MQDKIKQTNIKKYGVENPQQNKEIKNKTTHTNLIKYGNACAVHNPDIWNKAINTMKKNGNYSSLEDYLERYFIRNYIVLWNKNDIDDFIQNFTNSTA